MSPDKKRHYFQKVFTSDEGQKVLLMLAEFAHADDADFCQDPRKDAYMQGRRSVILEIRNIIKEKESDE
jgi:hypothetical protein